MTSRSLSPINGDFLWRCVRSWLMVQHASLCYPFILLQYLVFLVCIFLLWVVQKSRFNYKRGSFGRPVCYFGGSRRDLLPSMRVLQLLRQVEAYYSRRPWPARLFMHYICSRLTSFRVCLLVLSLFFGKQFPLFRFAFKTNLCSCCCICGEDVISKISGRLTFSTIFST